MNSHVRILIIDDEESIRDSVGLVLEKEGYGVRSVVSGQEGISLFSKEAFQVVYLDLKLPGINGLDVLSRLKKISLETPVIIITGYATIESAVEAMKRGAFDYLTKPFTPEEVRVTTRKALESRRLFLENISLRRELEG